MKHIESYHEYGTFEKKDKINGGINMIKIGKLLQVDETDGRETGEVELKECCAVLCRRKREERSTACV